ncbi:uncharacterized protein AFUA_6G00180 [Aspergillus fumigatus Af293]|uniref:Uncharacterized protein n=1 Tax=Aspergillus fumigatus (strain ATCC MYA-4609 / CBS 101355 / FGSC A1100 / Af293) TaxID=330879 RepID=Q4W8X0_ASPFU|nr:hypothetical protein AFUA_6G00180 [Aspergillus fumigatus Af293]EAL84249.1 hypothetical protein AFUA_6G00180 [Aspergillus fumigatus Af293]
MAGYKVNCKNGYSLEVGADGGQAWYGTPHGNFRWTQGYDRSDNFIVWDNWRGIMNFMLAFVTPIAMVPNYEKRVRMIFQSGSSAEGGSGCCNHSVDVFSASNLKVRSNC